VIYTRWIGILSVLLLVLGGSPAAAQSSADTFFHDAAQRYVTGDVEAARQIVTRGLKTFPSDPRLQALQKKLKQTEGNREGGRSSQRGTQSQKQGETSKQGQEERSETSGQETRPEAEEASDQESSRRTDAGSADGASGGKGAAQGGSRGQKKGPKRQRANSLTQTQAARLLSALENQEEKLLREVRGQIQEGRSVEKDW
jgi:hypothetical protein